VFFSDETILGVAFDTAPARLADRGVLPHASADSGAR
jgi:hypothetical protein